MAIRDHRHSNLENHRNATETNNMTDIRKETLYLGGPASTQSVSKPDFN
jgi:hypothetical protein